MKILIIGPFPDPITGQSLSNKMLLKELKDKNEIDYINTNFYTKLTDKKKQGKFDFKKIIIVLRNFSTEFKKIINNKYDVVYMTPGGTFLGFLRFSHYIILSSYKKDKIFLHIHNGYFRKMYDSKNKFNKKILRVLLNKVAGVIVLGESLKIMFQDIINDNKVFVCENGVQDEIIATEDEINKKIEIYKQDPKKRVLYLSNLMEEKGILDLLKVSEKFNDEEIEFNLAGAIEPSIKEEVEKYLKRYSNKIKYHGIINGEEKKKLLLENYIFILPSYDEGQPISILEAYITGCAVITDEDIGGIKDIFKNNINGLSIKSKNIEDIFEKIKEINELEYFEKNYKYSKEKYLKFFFVERIKKIIIKGWIEK